MGCFQFMPKKIKPSSSDEKVQPSGQNTKKVSSALTSNGYSNYMQTIILKDVKAQANKIKRDARKLKEVRALEKANAEKEKARQRKIKEKQEAQKKKIEECRRKYETELHAGRLTHNCFHNYQTNHCYSMLNNKGDFTPRSIFFV